MLSHTAGLNRRQALPLAFGSVAGSGVLLLPSAVYSAAGGASGWVWLSATLLCVPMLVLFADLVRDAPPGRGMEWVITRGLGPQMGRCVPVLFLAVVALGLPGGAVVAGAYASRALSAGSPVTVCVAVAVLALAVALTLAGASISGRAQRASTWLLVCVVAVLAALAVAHAPRAGFSNALAGPPHPGVVLPEVVLAFWAFAGFENLTFLSAELRHPDRDFLPVSVAALGLYAALTVVLTLAVAAVVPRGQVDPLAGLLQLAEFLPSRTPVIAAVLATAVTAMVMNAVAWTWGVSRLITGAAQDGILPRALAVLGPRGAPVRAALLLAALFATSVSVMLARPGLVVPAISAASSVFLVLYALCILAYLRITGARCRALLVTAPLLVIVPSLTRSGWTALFAPAIAGAHMLVRALAHAGRKGP